MEDILTHTCKPTKICEWLIDAAKCVPFVSGVEISLLDSKGIQTVVSLQEVHEADIAMPPVPQLGNGNQNHPNNNSIDITANATANAAAANAEKIALKEQLNMQAQHVKTLEKTIAELKAAVQAANEPKSPPAKSKTHCSPKTEHISKRPRRGQ